ncbi:hypothetical protein [Streptodolium elevatio]
MRGTTPEDAGRDDTGHREAADPGVADVGVDTPGVVAPLPADPRRGDLGAADFWGGAVPMAADAPLVPDPAVARLGVPDLAIRGRNPADLVRPAYDALTSR